MISTILNQKISKQLGPSLFEVQQDQLSLIVIKHPTCQAAVSLQGAQLLFWQPNSEKRPIVWLSDKTAFTQGKAIRGGVPICWPWFGPLGSPSHGFARAVLWQLTDHHEDENGVTLTLSLSDTEQTRQLWDHAFKATVTIKLGATCYIEMATEGEFSATAALHSYFDVTDIAKIKLTGLGDVYKESLKTINRPKKSGELTFDQAVDRIYTHPESSTLIHDVDRTIKVTHYDGSDVVAWNPWQETSIAMQDMADDGFKTMVCVETARINKPLESSKNKIAKLAVKIERIE